MATEIPWLTSFNALNPALSEREAFKAAVGAVLMTNATHVRLTANEINLLSRILEEQRAPTTDGIVLEVKELRRLVERPSVKARG